MLLPILEMDNTNEDNIRDPDPIKIDRLIDDDDFHNINENKNHILRNNEYDLNTVLEISKKEFDTKQQQEEQKTIELICKNLKEEQQKERQNKFNNIKIQLNKIILFDKHNLGYYELILSIIEMYEINVINEYKTTQEEYTNIFNVLKTIRLPMTEIDSLKKLFVCK